jgi:hypothetical protein
MSVQRFIQLIFISWALTPFVFVCIFVCVFVLKKVNSKLAGSSGSSLLLRVSLQVLMTQSRQRFSAVYTDFAIRFLPKTLPLPSIVKAIITHKVGLRLTRNVSAALLASLAGAEANTTLTVVWRPIRNISATAASSSAGGPIYLHYCRGWSGGQGGRGGRGWLNVCVPHPCSCVPDRRVICVIPWTPTVACVRRRWRGWRWCLKIGYASGWCSFVDRFWFTKNIVTWLTEGLCLPVSDRELHTGLPALGGAWFK